MAAEEGARAREAARARSRPPAAPRAGDGRPLARPRAGGGGEQPPPGGARRAARARRRTRSRFATRCSSSSARRRRRPARARRGRRAPHGDAGRLPRRARDLRRRAASGEPLRRLGGRAGATSSPSSCAELAEELAALGPADGPRGLPTDASSFVGRGRELAELRALLGHTRLLTLSGTGGAGKTRLALELARARRGVVRRTAPRSSSSPRSPIRGSCRTPSRRRSTCGRCRDRTSSTRSSTSSRRARCCSSSTTASTCSGRAPRSPTRSSVPRRG